MLGVLCRTFTQLPSHSNTIKGVVHQQEPLIQQIMLLLEPEVI